jgi:hypothetical protein
MHSSSVDFYMLLPFVIFFSTAFIIGLTSGIFPLFYFSFIFLGYAFAWKKSSNKLKNLNITLKSMYDKYNVLSLLLSRNKINRINNIFNRQLNEDSNDNLTLIKDIIKKIEIKRENNLTKNNQEITQESISKKNRENSIPFYEVVQYCIEETPSNELSDLKKDFA